MPAFFRRDPLDRYNHTLENATPPGSGCHSWILSAANLGAIAGLDPHEIHEDIRQAIPPGKRHIPDREISDAIHKALSDLNGGTYTPRPKPKPVVKDGTAAQQAIIYQGKYSTRLDLLDNSPIPLTDDPAQDTILFLRTLFKPDDLIFIGERYESGIMGQTIRHRDEWIHHFEAGGKTSPHIILNPLDGIPGPTKGGDKTTLRGDQNVKEYRHSLVEFDTLPREDQIRFFSAVKLPIMALIDSGGKSIHAVIDVSKLASVTTADEWQQHVKDRLYAQFLVPLGCDPACSNPARLSRLPGHFRAEKQAWQRSLWLSPSGRA